MKIFWIVIMTFGAEPSIELHDDYTGGTYQECMAYAAQIDTTKYEKDGYDLLTTCLFIDEQ